MPKHIFLTAPFHQASPLFASRTRNRQCMANCLAFFATTLHKPIATWGQADLGTILRVGDALYAFVRDAGVQHDHLLPTDLPDFFTYSGLNLHLVNKATHAGLLSLPTNVCPRNIYTSLENAVNLALAGVRDSHAIIVFNSSAIGVHFTGNSFYTFDPHERNERALCGGAGAAVLCCFTSVTALCDFLRLLALSQGSTQLIHTQFDMHILKLSVVAAKYFHKKLAAKPAVSRRPRLFIWPEPTAISHSSGVPVRFQPPIPSIVDTSCALPGLPPAPCPHNACTSSTATNLWDLWSFYLWHFWSFKIHLWGLDSWFAASSAASQTTTASTATNFRNFRSFKFWSFNFWGLNLWCLNHWCLNRWCLNHWCLNHWFLNLWNLDFWLFDLWLLGNWYCHFVIIVVWSSLLSWEYHCLGKIHLYWSFSFLEDFGVIRSCWCSIDSPLLINLWVVEMLSSFMELRANFELSNWSVSIKERSG